MKVLLFLLSVLLGACAEPTPETFQGYAEGEFVYVASPRGGRLEVLAVRRGQNVHPGEVLFQLERDSELDAVREASERLRQAEDRLADLRKGRRPSEIAALQAKLKQATAELKLAEVTYQRRQGLYAKRSIAKENLDQARSEYERLRARVKEMVADLKTAHLGGRIDAIKAAEAESKAARAKLEQVKWNLDQKTQAASQNGLVYDRLYYQGEWVPAGRPVLVLLPPENIKIRFFVPEKVVGELSLGQKVWVSFDGSDGPLPAHISYISPKEEYTPPVIYSSQSRAKLVFMVEARPEPESATRFHPGQPVDVSLFRSGNSDG